jgi:hypothetical protein
MQRGERRQMHQKRARSLIVIPQPSHTTSAACPEIKEQKRSRFYFKFYLCI